MGRRVVVTRAPEQASELMGVLEGLGAEVLLLPTIGFAPPEDWQLLDHELGKLERFDALLFVSKNAVQYILARCRDLGIQHQTLPKTQLVAAVGPATAEAATKEGFRVGYVAKNHTGQGLARELGEQLRGKRVFLPRSDRADGRLPGALREIGAEVTEVVAYRTVEPAALNRKVLESVRKAQVDAVVFASPSAFHNLCRSIPAAEMAELSQRVEFVAIGPTTARALRDVGARVAVESTDASLAALSDAMVSYYEKHPAAMRRA